MLVNGSSYYRSLKVVFEIILREHANILRELQLLRIILIADFNPNMV